MGLPGKVLKSIFCCNESTNYNDELKGNIILNILKILPYAEQLNFGNYMLATYKLRGILHRKDCDDTSNE